MFSKPRMGELELAFGTGVYVVTYYNFSCMSETILNI